LLLVGSVWLALLLLGGLGRGLAQRSGSFWSSRGPVLLGIGTLLGLALAYRHAPYDGYRMALLALATTVPVAPLLVPDLVHRAHRLLCLSIVHAGWLAVAVLTTVAVNAPAAVSAGSWRALGFVWYVVPATLGSLPVRLGSWFFHDQPGTTGLLPTLPALLVVELLWPGVLATWMSRLSRGLVQRIQSVELRLTLDLHRGQAALCVCLLVGVVLAWRQTLASGYSLDATEALRLLGRFARFYFLPAVVLAIELRSSWYRKLVRRIDESASLSAES
jgi:hypothetical protein